MNARSEIVLDKLLKEDWWEPRIIHEIKKKKNQEQCKLKRFYD